MLMYSKNGKEVNVDKDQVTVMEGAGYTRTKAVKQKPLTAAEKKAAEEAAKQSNSQSDFKVLTDDEIAELTIAQKDEYFVLKEAHEAKNN